MPDVICYHNDADECSTANSEVTKLGAKVGVKFVIGHSWAPLITELRGHRGPEY
jgi:hypothetical protein